MEINVTRPIDVKLPADRAKVSSSGQTENTPKTTKGEQPTSTNVRQLSHDDLQNITVEMNKFLLTINSDIQFELHDKTKQLMVQVVDTKEQKILKEFPPHELLDTIAKIRDYVGFLLDKKV